MLNATWHFAVTLDDVDTKLILSDDANKVTSDNVWFKYYILLNLWQGQLHLIWAYGQLSDFYQADQLKYHGRKTRWLLNRYLQFTT